MKTFKEKGYTIKIWEQTPDMKYEKRDFEEEFQGQGTHGYEVLNPKGKRIWCDTWDMWDEDACYQNACQDIDADLEQKGEIK